MYGNMDPAKRQKPERDKQRLQDNWAAFMDDLGDDGRHRMIVTIDTLMAGIKKRSVTVEMGSDGRYHLPKSEKAPEPGTAKNDSEV